jgi:hypothetical protein
MRTLLNNCAIAAALLLALGTAHAAPPRQTSDATMSAAKPPVPVTVKNFARAKSDKYFGDTVKLGGFGKFFHYRTPTPIEDQKVVKMNRDTLYSAAIFDLDAGPVTVTLPEVGKRFMSMLIINEDHYAPLVVYAAGRTILTKQQCGTRYIMAVIRTLADFEDLADVKAANAAQDKTQVQQAGIGTFETPNWDQVSQNKIRDSLAVLQSMSGATTEKRMGKKE